MVSVRPVRVPEGPLVPGDAAHPDICDICHLAMKAVADFLLLVTWLLFMIEQFTYLHKAHVQGLYVGINS